MENQYGVIFTTCEHPLTLAEALVHEMAHNKLFALGINIEGSARFITNPARKLFDSPVILDRQRPMTAVFHAEYSFVHILQLNLLMYESETDPELRNLILQLMTDTAGKMAKGWQVIHDHVQTDRDGARFVGGFLEWAAEVIAAAQALIARPISNLNSPSHAWTR